MSVQVRARREAAAFLSTYVGAQGELLVDTTNNRVQVHDGATPGGWPAARLAEVVANTRTAVADAAYNALASDRTIAVTSLTAARTITLPAAAAYPTGTQLLVFDESGACSATNTITLARAGTDTINGAVSATIAAAYGYLALESNGAGKWTVVDQTPTAGASASRTAVNDANYTALTTDRTIAYTALTAPRTVTLPAASAFQTGTQLFVVDESGACSSGNTITVARAGSDTINGTTSGAIPTAYGYLAFTSNGAGKWTVVDQTPAASTGSSAAVPRGFISGLTLSNDATTPNSVLDVSAGSAADNAGAVLINLAAFTKSTGGAWAAGSGANGMGNGLAIAASTWYHVFAIVKGGVADVYFDTSVTAANAPSGTTAFRRLGSIKTNSSAQITKFSQNGNEFLWYAVTFDINMGSGFGTTATLFTLNVPPGVKVNALISVTTPTANNNSYVQSPDQSGTQGTAGQVASSSPLWAAINVRTNTAAQIQAYSQVANAAFYEVTSGWVDTRGA